MTKEQAETVFQQMGGKGRLKAMIGAKGFAFGPNGASFGFCLNQKINVLIIKLNAWDLYDLEFWKMTAGEEVLVESVDGVYNDMLIDIFESTTGLSLRL